MRNVASAFIIAVGSAILAIPAVRAQDQANPSTPSPHVQQHQDAAPNPEDQATRRDQSAQTPQSPAVITPPSTGDQSVIIPPTTGAAKTPVIPPPGTPGGNGQVQPK